MKSGRNFFTKTQPCARLSHNDEAAACHSTADIISASVVVAAPAVFSGSTGILGLFKHGNNNATSSSRLPVVRRITFGAHLFVQPSRAQLSAGQQYRRAPATNSIDVGLSRAHSAVRCVTQLFTKFARTCAIDLCVCPFVRPSVRPSVG